MSSLHDVLLFLHGLNRWLAFLVGIWTVGQVLPGITGRRVFTSIEHRSIALFTGTLYLQMALGLLLFAVMSMQNIPVFSGRSAVQWGHMGGGLLAALFGTLAFVLRWKTTTDRTQYRVAALWTVLALLLLGQTLLMAALLGLLLLIRLVITILRNYLGTR